MERLHDLEWRSEPRSSRKNGALDTLPMRFGYTQQDQKRNGGTVHVTVYKAGHPCRIRIS